MSTEYKFLILEDIETDAELIMEHAQSYQLQTYDFSWKSGKIEKDDNDRWA